MKAGSNTWIVVLASAAMAAGCNMVGGRGWIPQGSGDVPQAKEEPVARAPAPRRPVAKPVEEQPAVSPFRAAASGTAPAPAPAPAPRAPEPTPSAPAATSTTLPAGGYTQATRYGDLVFVSGQIAIDPRTNHLVGENRMDEQTRQVMENIRAILESHRLTMANVVSVTVYLKDLAQFRAMDDAYEKFFRSNLPARSVVEVARLPRGALVEISVVAGR